MASKFLDDLPAFQTRPAFVRWTPEALQDRTDFSLIEETMGILRDRFSKQLAAYRTKHDIPEGDNNGL